MAMEAAAEPELQPELQPEPEPEPELELEPEPEPELEHDLQPEPEPELQPEPELDAKAEALRRRQRRLGGRLSGKREEEPVVELELPARFAHGAELRHAASAPPPGHSAESPHGHTRELTAATSSRLSSPRPSGQLKEKRHPSQRPRADKHSYEEVRLCARLMRERLRGHGDAQGRGVEEVDVGKALGYLTNSGEASNEFQAARLAQRMIDAEIWYHVPNHAERKDFTLDLDRDELFRFANTAPLSRKLWQEYHASVEKAREEQSKHHEMRATDSGDVLVLKLKQAFVRKAKVRRKFKHTTRRTMSRHRLVDETSKKADLADVGIEAVAAAAKLAGREEQAVEAADSTGDECPQPRIETTDVSAAFSRETFQAVFANRDHVCTRTELDAILERLEKKDGIITLPQSDREREDVAHKIFTYLDENDTKSIDEAEFVNVSRVDEIACEHSCCLLCVCT